MLEEDEFWRCLRAARKLYVVMLAMLGAFSAVVWLLGPSPGSPSPFSPTAVFAYAVSFASVLVGLLVMRRRPLAKRMARPGVEEISAPAALMSRAVTELALYEAPTVIGLSLTLTEALAGVHLPVLLAISFAALAYAFPREQAWRRELEQATKPTASMMSS